MRGIAVAIATLILAGCQMPEMERSPSYDAGFADGCATAAAQGPGVPREPRRNEELYARDKDYRMGWTSGLAQCRVQLPNRL